MTNFQEDGGGQFFGDRFARRVVFWTPVGLGASLAALVLVIGIVPSLLRSGSTQESLETAQALASQLPRARRQLEEERRRNERIQQQRETLLSLIGRPGTLATFLAAVDRLAAAQQVQLDLYEPQAATAAPAAAGTPPAAASPPSQGRPGGSATQAGSALQVEGLQRTTLLLSARGTYPALLRFLRALERLDVLVAQSDLSLTLEPSPPSSAPVTPPPPTAVPSSTAPAPPAGATPVAAATPAPATVPTAVASSAPPRVVMKLTISLYEPDAGRPTGSQLPGRP